jgi:putative Holliday junction resolvase
MEARGKILALDYGAKNVGIACSDDFGLTVNPLPSIPNHGKKALIRLLKKMLIESGIREIVIGMPLNMNGSSGDAVRKVENFISALDSDLCLPVNRFDERLSTVEALEIWKKMHARQHKKYRTVDSLAAALILERYLKET